MAESIDFQIRMKTACTKEISTFCRNVPHGHARVIRSALELLIAPCCCLLPMHVHAQNQVRHFCAALHFYSLEAFACMRNSWRLRKSTSAQ